jgi:hypothetical protein
VPLCPPQTPTWTDAGSNPGLRSERPATNRLSHGTAETSEMNNKPKKYVSFLSYVVTFILQWQKECKLLGSRKQAAYEKKPTSEVERGRGDHKSDQHLYLTTIRQIK